jgi:hypothetical protein
MQALLNSQLRVTQSPTTSRQENKRGAACEDSAAEHVEDTTTNQVLGKNRFCKIQVLTSGYIYIY